MSNSYLRDKELYGQSAESSLPSINGTRGRSASRIIDLEDDHRHHHHHHSNGHHHNSHHHHHDDSSKHVRFSTQLSGSTSSLNRADFVGSSSREYSPGPSCQAKRQVLELQDQLRICREELRRKDELVTKLTEGNSSQSRHVDFNYSKIEEAFSSERAQSLAAARSEVAALQVKSDGLTAQLAEVKNQLDCRENKIRDLTHEVESVRESEAKHVAIAQSLRERIIEYEQNAGSFEGAVERNEIVISSLKREKDECNTKILELESKLRTYWEERESYSQQMSSYELKYKDLVSNLTSLFGMTDIHVCYDSTSELISKIKDVYIESSSLREKVSSLNEYVRAAEVENRASRETILRIANESEEKQTLAARYSMDTEKYKQDMEIALARRREVELELSVMKERLEASQNAWAATRKELEEKESKFTSYSMEVRNQEMMSRGHQEHLRSFRETLASILSEDCCRVEPFEDQIKERVSALVINSRDKTAHIELLDSKIRTLNEELSRYSEMQKSADRRAKRVESDYFEIEGKFRQLESELASEKIMRDGFRGDKDKYMHFLEDCCRLLKLDIIVSDVGMEMVIDAILHRCDQVQKMELEAINEKQTLIYNLQRKHKSLKEQLESRDLHIDLLRKKVVALEERVAGRSELEKEKDTETLKSKKLMKLIEKYKKELQEAHIEMSDMKAKLLETTEYRNRTLEAEGHISCLESQVGQLENVRQKQAGKITHLQTSLTSKSDDLNSNLSSANQTIQALTRELKTTKTAFDEFSKREKQLLDLRQVISRMLGLDVNVLAVPDYEIIARLEKLILAHQSSAATAIAVEGAIVDMEDGFREGYNKSGRVFVRARSPTRTKVTRVRTRTRSMSPTRRKDHRSY